MVATTLRHAAASITDEPTRIVAPAALAGPWRNVLTGSTHARLLAPGPLDPMPVAVLIWDGPLTAP